MNLDIPIPPDEEWYVVAQSADCRQPADAPIYIHDWPLLLAHARKSLQSRQEIYPAWIERGQIGADEAAQDIQAWRWIVGEWEWVITGQGAPPPHGSLRQRQAAVKLSLHRIDAQLRRGVRTHDTYRQAHVAIALDWHLTRLRDDAPAIHFVARFNHRLRRQRAGQLEMIAG